MPSYPKKPCLNCGSITGTKDGICATCLSVCPVCGESKSRKGKFCKKCYSEHQSQNPELQSAMRTSESRSKAIKSLNKYYEENGKSLTKKCAVCEKEFSAHKQDQLYCSQTCAQSVAGLKRRKRKSYDCVVCGKTFEKVVYREAKYCSKECWGNRGRSSSECPNCGKIFDYKTSTGRKYCSMQCRTEHMVGERSPAWKDGKSLERQRARYSSELKKWRKQVFARDGFKCVHCGKKDIQAHHIIPFAESLDLAFFVPNGITLCTKCHGDVHGKDFTSRRKKQCPDCGISTTGRGVDGRCKRCGAKHGHSTKKTT